MRKTTKSVLALVTLAGLAAVAAPAQASTFKDIATPAGPAGVTASVTAAVTAELDHYLREHGASDHFSALSVRVTYPDQRRTLVASTGTTTYGGHTPVSDDALWQIGSNTKAMTSVVLLQLEAEGKVNIHDTLGTWLPQYPAWRDVTIKQLLSMTSGIPDYLNTQTFADAMQKDPTTRFTAPDLISWVTGEDLGPPTYSYSNTNYLLAQLIIEKAGHQNYFAQVERRILKPLRLRNTCFAPETCSPGIENKLTESYFTQDGLPGLLNQPVPKLALSWGQGAGGVVSSLADLTTWDRALYEGRELPEKQQNELRSLVSVVTGKPVTTVTHDDPVAFGLGVAQRLDPVGGLAWAYEGGTLGTRVLHIYFPDTGILLALGVNSSGNAEADTLPALVDTIYQTVRKPRSAG